MAELVEPVERAEPFGRTGRAARVGPWPPLAAVRARLDVRAWSAVQRFILVLAMVYLVKQAVYVFLFPAFSGHDEVAHYAHLRIVAEEGRVPVIPDLEEWRASFQAGDPIELDRLPDELYRYCRYTTQDQYCAPSDPRFRNGGPDAITWPPLNDAIFPSGWIYTANHPPLYYILMTPVYWLGAGASPATQLFLLRFAAIPFGLGTVVLAFLTARALFPTDGFLSVVAPAFVAFQTQVSYEAAMLNNDILCIALYSAVLYLLVLGIRDRFPNRLCFALGIVLGLAILTKGTSITAVGIAGLAALATLGFRDWRGLLRRGLIAGVPMLLLIAPWYVFLYRTYGNFTAFSQLKELQYWNEPAGTFFGILFDLDFAEMRFKETWGYWGWRLIPLSGTVLWAIGIPLLVALGGLVWYAVGVTRGRLGDPADPVAHPRRWQVLALGMLTLTCVVAYLAIIQFGVTFALTQARYFFPAVNAVALLLALGLRTLIPLRFHPYGQGIAVAAMVVMNVLIFSQFVIPYWHLSFD